MKNVVWSNKPSYVIGIVSLASLHRKVVCFNSEAAWYVVMKAHSSRLQYYACVGAESYGKIRRVVFGNI